MSPPKVNNFTIKDLNNSEADELSMDPKEQ
jgi:hypothetical protein